MPCPVPFFTFMVFYLSALSRKLYYLIIFLPLLSIYFFSLLFTNSLPIIYLCFGYFVRIHFYIYKFFWDIILKNRIYNFSCISYLFNYMPYEWFFKKFSLNLHVLGDRQRLFWAWIKLSINIVIYTAIALLHQIFPA